MVILSLNHCSMAGAAAGVHAHSFAVGVARPPASGILEGHSLVGWRTLSVAPGVSRAQSADGRVVRPWVDLVACTASEVVFAPASPPALRFERRRRRSRARSPIHQLAHGTSAMILSPRRSIAGMRQSPRAPGACTARLHRASTGLRATGRGSSACATPLASVPRHESALRPMCGSTSVAVRNGSRSWAVTWSTPCTRSSSPRQSSGRVAIPARARCISRRSACPGRSSSCGRCPRLALLLLWRDDERRERLAQERLRFLGACSNGSVTWPFANARAL
jgi:hypothetical protein